MPACPTQDCPSHRVKFLSEYFQFLGEHPGGGMGLKNVHAGFEAMEGLADLIDRIQSSVQDDFPVYPDESDFFKSFIRVDGFYSDPLGSRVGIQGKLRFILGFAVKINRNRGPGTGKAEDRAVALGQLDIANLEFNR